MNVRIIGGRFGGRKLSALPGDRTHPMSERARNAIFNSLIGELEDAEVLDAFAGTGAIGLEALSRGAKSVVFVEKDRAAQRNLQANIQTVKAEDEARLISTSVSNWLESAQSEQFDLIFVDPPYNDPQFSTVEKLLGLLKPKGLMVLSHPGRSEVPTKTGVVVVDNRSYGNAHLTFYRRE